MTKCICVYFIKNPINNHSYIGYTVDLEHRLRQHKGEIKGGAKRTQRWNGNVELVAYIKGFQTKNQAMSYEWHAKRRKRKIEPHRRHWRLAHFLKPLTFPKFQNLNLESIIC